MYALREQRTIARSVAVAGFGYWSGLDNEIEFRPAAADTGIVFVRRDLPQQPRIAAIVANRVETPRRTTLRAEGASVEMIEHVMAALAGLQIDNCEVWVDAAEMPGFDGSSLAVVEALDSAGTVGQGVARPRLIVREVTRLGDEESWVEAQPPRRSGMSLKFRLDYGRDNPIGRQTLQLEVTPDSFRRELASSRTFLMQHEAEWLRSQGLGSRTTASDLLIFDDVGPVDNELRFRDECVRHKALDLVGDLALAGCDLVGHFVAHRSGHRLNSELVRILLTEGEMVRARRRSA